ncbi:DUF3558 domain-containing protein [Amycolatopsis sp. cg5]|uniref:DUF3558 domain-containing protein n=1 Tax=Amycolatopsis sp. cg5 TaxID=3238802 RepID=UPI0035261AF3
MIRRRIAVTGVGLLVLAAAGCTGGGTTPGTPSPVPSSGAGSSSVAPDTSAPGQGLPYAGAPKVTTPFPESLFAGDPCADSMNPQQIDTAIGAPVKTKRADEDRIGPGCDWLNTVTGGHVIMAYGVKLKDGLSAIYKNVQPSALKWEPLTLQGFPAVAYVGPSGGTPDRFCQISIGATDNTTIEVSMFLGDTTRGKKNPCDAANTVANLIMTSLREKAGN